MSDRLGNYRKISEDIGSISGTVSLMAGDVVLRFAEAFDSFLTGNGISASALALMCDSIGTSHSMISEYRRGIRVPQNAAWQSMKSALETNNTPIPMPSGHPADSTEEFLDDLVQRARIEFNVANPRGRSRRSVISSERIQVDASEEDAEIVARSGFSRASQIIDSDSSHELELSMLSAELNAKRLSVGKSEAEYFAHVLKVYKQVPFESVRAYIRLNMLRSNPHRPEWMESYYEEVEALVRAGRLEVRYVLLLADPEPTEQELALIDRRLMRFASEVKVLAPTPACPDLRPSIVLLDRQEVVFTHDRDDLNNMTHAMQYLAPVMFAHFDRRFNQIEGSSWRVRPVRPNA